MLPNGVVLLSRRRRREAELRRLREWQRQQLLADLRSFFGTVLYVSCGTFTGLMAGVTAMAHAYPGVF